jgi:hypothetical protein
MMALDLRNDWRTVEKPKPWRSLFITLLTAFVVAGALLIRQPSLAEAAPPPPAAPATPVEAPAPPPVAVVVAPPAPEPVAPTAVAPTSHKKKKHVALSPEEQTRRALARLQRAQLDRATNQ